MVRLKNPTPLSLDTGYGRCNPWNRPFRGLNACLTGEDSDVEIRPIFEDQDFGEEFTPELREQEMRTRERVEHQQAKKERIMHMALPIGGNIIIMGSDISEGMGQKLISGNNVYVSLHPESKEETVRLCGALFAQGKVEMPLEKMFWGAYFASFTDKFDVPWMIHYEEK